MNLKHVWIVFKKEVKDISRDRRTLLTNLLIPIILMPLLFTFLGGSMEKMERDITENITVALTRESDTEEIRNLLENEVFRDYPNIKLSGTVDNPEAAIQNDEFRFVIDVDKDYSARLEQGVPYTITIHYDQSDSKSSGSYGILAEAVYKYSEKTVQKRLAEMGIDLQILEPVKIVEVNAARDDASGNIMIMMMLPMLASILIAVGGIPAATDLVAGEKERGTFEPLLTTQAGRMSVLFGKYLTVTLFSFVSVVAQLIGVVIGGVINPTFFTMAEGGSGQLSFSIPPAALLLSILTVITLGMVFSAIQLAISTYARSFKEAQTYLSFLIFVAMIPSYATMMMQPDDLQLYMFAVPLLNAIASLKMILGSVINYTYLGIALGSSLIYVVLSLIFAAWMFNREKYLFRN